MGKDITLDSAEAVVEQPGEGRGQGWRAGESQGGQPGAWMVPIER